MDIVDDQKFFAYGHIKLVSFDIKERQAVVNISIPFVVLFAIIPQILHCGYMDSFQIKDPMCFWVPELGSSRFNEQFNLSGVPSSHVNEALKNEVIKMGKLFSHMVSYVRDPSDIVPILPVGIYVVFNYRFRIDDSLSILEKMNSINVVGVPEFQTAFSSTVRDILIAFDKMSPPQQLLS